MKILVAGAGGFIGGHLVKSLLDQGHAVRAVDIKPAKDWLQVHAAANNWEQADLRSPDKCWISVCDIDYVYNLACNMGGMGFIETHKAECMLSVLINTHLLLAAKDAGVERYLFASSACVYAAGKQKSSESPALAEKDAYPADAEDGYGWEKLFSERMCRHFAYDYGVQVRIPRLHNVYGPHGTWKGGREKAPAAICRKVIEAKLGREKKIEIWGDGEQTRSFMWIGDCVKGVQMIMNSAYSYPINLGSNELVSINQLVDTAEEIADIKLERIYRPDMPRGVMGRNSDNTLIRSLLHWEPSTKLRAGLESTYRWIYDEYSKGFK
jgi:nucleoside-diphosphate-sugar epimerase